MSVPARTDFAGYLRQLADAVGLKDWTFAIAPEGPRNDSALAEIICVYGQRHARILLSDSFLVRTPEEQRSTLVHELIHCHLDAAAELAEENLGPELAREYRRHTEYAVDALARALARHLPCRLTMGET